MNLDVFSYRDIQELGSNHALATELNAVLKNKGIMGVSHVPHFIEYSQAYTSAVRKFVKLPEEVKRQYAPDRDAGVTEGYELGAEWFQNEDNEWKLDDKKASFYAHIADHKENVWPTEVDLKTPYLALGNLMRTTAILLLDAMGITKSFGLNGDDWKGYGRMLHYQKVGSATDSNTNWCGAHFDHGAFTCLMPARYFRGEVEIEEPEEAGLHIVPTGTSDFVKVRAPDKSILLFQVGEFLQLASDDRIAATKHLVRKARGDIERIALATFIDPPDDIRISSASVLAKDERFSANLDANHTASYKDWASSSYERYRAINPLHVYSK